MTIRPPPAPGNIAQRALVEASAARSLKRTDALSPSLMELGGGQQAEGDTAPPGTRR